ncbi:DUF982 domain-containing protein [Agrobacterium sp. OT33]|uniref:DUF982 domain-containing protein n=1 Tax=Agrobacterium sp. OT33 TaxID=2815338 RepID=UPI001A8CDCCC|nr:DUF982 domain-containing protein [Agrobacterium sp. OT33]MBO0125234.1 DUF982 domain-containing protein [Agrobacterium sp. OT33]
MKSGSWDNTVTIELGGRSKTYARISTTRGAASYLIDQWPGSRDFAYKEAIISCTQALKGEVNDEAAFNSFVQAALVSGLKYTSAPSHAPNEFERDIARALTQSMLNDLRNPPQKV